MKKSSGTISFIVSGSIFLSGAIILSWWVSSYTSWQLREHLQILSPLFLEINFFLIVLAIIINSRVLKSLFFEIPKRIRLYLGAIALLGLLICAFVVPRAHRIYYDEDIYQNIGQNIAYLKSSGTHYGEGYLESFNEFWKRFIGRAAMCNEGKNDYGEYSCNRLEYNKEPNGWPYIISLAFRLTGVHELTSFLTNNLCFLLSILTVFFTGYLLFGSLFAGIYAALIFALTPEMLLWSNTTAVEPSAAFFTGLALLGTLIFIKYRESKTLFLAVVITAFAIQFRPESIMVLVLIGLVILFWGRDELKKGRFYVLVSIFFILIIPHLVHLYAVKDMGWGSAGPKFSLKFLTDKDNFKVNFLFYLKNIRFPLFFTILFVLGIFLRLKKENRGNTSQPIACKAVVLTWFLLFWGIFLFFYAGSYNYGADVRFSLLSAMPIALLAGYGLASLEYLLGKNGTLAFFHPLVTAMILLSFISFFPFVRAITQEAWGARADHQFARQMAEAIPEDALILTHNPNMFLLWGKSAAQASLATEQRGYFQHFFDRYQGGIYFHYNFWCNVSDPLQNSFCTNILRRYKCTPVLSFKEKNYEYVLYKVTRQ